jgi:RimJ/RimL family protein N-acetyltransferase
MLVLDAERVDNFVRQYVPGASLAGFKAIGLERGGELTAGIVYEAISATNVWCHIAAKPGGHSMNAEFIRAIFNYPFDQLGLRRMSAFVDPRNTAVIRFMEHLGFKREAVLSEAADDGGDMAIYVMKRMECKYG